MIVAGVDSWDLSKSRRVDEPRLARHLGVDSFRAPPYYSVKEGTGGIPARIFPRILVCPRCNRLAAHTAFEFSERGQRHLCKAPGCHGDGKSIAYPARFIVACSKGHLADFPWHAYVHGPDVKCADELRLEDSARTGAITDIWVRCHRHGVAKNLGEAFGREGRRRLPRCRGERPWLGDVDPRGCGNELRVLLRGASNAYFPVVASAISIPPWSDPIQNALGPHVDLMAKVDSLAKMQGWLDIANAPELGEFTAELLWDALRRRRAGGEQATADLKQEEWQAFHSSSAARIDSRSEFQSRSVSVPPEVSSYMSKVSLLERLREVRALRGFTRVDSIPDVGDLGEVEAYDAGLAPIRRARSSWLPAVDFRGEGLFLEFDEGVVGKWESEQSQIQLADLLGVSEKKWLTARGAKSSRSHSVRYVLLHSFAHLLMRRLALDCGYSSASLRERIYATTADSPPMAGILIYTASADSEGSLGGLVEMGNPGLLGPLIARALEEARLCANDPLCADRAPGATGNHLNGAACHSCLLASETACEVGNHYLDRGVVVSTVADGRHAFISS